MSGFTREGDALTIAGRVTRVRFEADDGDFQVVLVRADRVEHPVVVRGIGLREGDQVTCTGVVQRTRRGELQLQAANVDRVLPKSKEGIEAYLATGPVSGIGPKIAAAIVAAFGDATLDILDATPERLTEVPGIGKKRAAQLAAVWGQQRASREILVFLQSHGVSPAFAGRILRRFGDRAVRVVSEDPYRLAQEVDGIGFRVADRIASRVGIGASDPRRAAAGVLYVLQDALARGHTMLPRESLEASATALLGADAAAAASAVTALAARGDVVVESDPEIACAVYLRRSYVVECAVAAHVAALSAPSPSTGAGLHAAELAAVEARLSFALAPGQRVALERLVGARIGVLTGGPGTGKTTIVRAVVAAAAQRRLSVALAAPTGRAAKRLSESTGDDARTLHRLLSFDPRTGQFGRDGDTPLECDLVIVDEASMLDQELALALLSALSPATSLLLVGDVEQLPSVGAGEVLADLIRSECVAVARLDRVFRQAAESQILDCAHAIRGGEVPTPSVGPRGEYFFIEARDPGHAVQAVCRVVTARLPAAFGLDPVADVQVLAPMHGGALGTQVLNAALQEAIHGERPSGPALVRGARRVGVGDKVMQIRNNYDLEVFNGDIGVVTGVDVDALTLDVRFDEREVRYGREQIDDLVLAYAVSVHKSQGSEFRAVVLVLTTHHFKLLQRNLLYTAVTRARERLVIVGTQRALRMAIDDAAQERRYTRLAARIGRAAYEAPTTETAT